VTVTQIADETKWYALARRRRELDISRAFSFFLQSGIEPILIKGWAAARYYPEGQFRNYGDIDLAVSTQDHAEARKLLIDNSDLRLGVDLHREVRHLDTLEWSRLFQDSKIHQINGVPIRIACPEDHLRIISTHWLNDGGAPKERLWDIYYAVENRPVDFDWNRCLNVVSPGRQSWVVASVGLAHKYFGLEIDDLPFAAQARDLPGWLTRAVEKEWASGTRLIDLEYCIHDPKLLLSQLRKRIPPNPIQATIETEGPIDRSSRIKYQVIDVAKRIPSSIRRVSRELRNRSSRTK
jgi:hypothetical protein